jgi:hypothetical protein
MLNKLVFSAAVVLGTASAVFAAGTDQRTASPGAYGGYAYSSTNSAGKVSRRLGPAGALIQDRGNRESTGYQVEDIR